MTDFLECKLQDDIANDGIERGLAGSIRGRASHGEVWGVPVESVPRGSIQEELRLQVLQIQGELQQVDISLWDFRIWERAPSPAIAITTARATEEGNQEGDEKGYGIQG